MKYLLAVLILIWRIVKYLLPVIIIITLGMIAFSLLSRTNLPALIFGDTPEIKAGKPTAASSGLDIDKIINGDQSAEQSRDGAQVTEDTAQVVNKYHKDAEQGNAEAQLILGILYCGKSEKDEAGFAEGKKWLQKAAAHQDKDSQETAAIAKDIIKELEDIEAAIAEAEACKQLIQSKNKDKGTKNKDGKGIATLDKHIASLNVDLHVISGLIVRAHNQDQEAIEELNSLRQRRQLFSKSSRIILKKHTGTTKIKKSQPTIDAEQVFNKYRQDAEQGNAKAQIILT